MKKILWLVLFMFFQKNAFCQESDNVQTKQTKNTQVISFEDQLVEGSAKSPDLFYLLQKKNFRYRRLIKLREDFLPEIEATAEDLEESTDSGDDVGQ